MKTYQYRDGFRARPKIEAEQCHAILEQVRQQHNGNLTAPALVEAAKPKQHKLNHYFEWRDKVAGGKWREQQARNLIGAIQVQVDDHEPVRSYQIITKFQVVDNKTETEPVRMYANTEEALNDPDMRAQILRRCLAEVESLRRRYAALNELAKAFDALEQSIKEAA